jgi:hypothetical protein
MSAILEYVTLYLYDHGPSTLADIASHTQIPLNTLRTHLHTHSGERYLVKTTFEDGLPIRRWELAPTQHPSQEIEE